MFQTIAEIADYERERVGEARLEWLRGLPRVERIGEIALVHATPESLWRAPEPSASDGELAAAYGPLGAAVVVYGHVHAPFVRRAGAMTVINSGCLTMPRDGDRRASYVLLDDLKPTIRRVPYDVDREIAAVTQSGMPHSGYVALLLKS